MYKHLRITVRRLGRQKLTTALHIVGLTLGMSVCLLIGLFLRYELSFDTYHPKANRTYRINSFWNDNGNIGYHFSTPFPLADALRTEITGIETVAQAHPDRDEPLVEINPQKRFKQPHVLLVEPEFLDVFDVKVLRGNAYEALRKPYQALLTESTAKKFFGGEDPMGKTFKYRNQFDITVAGIIRDFPANTHLPTTMLLSLYKDEAFIHNNPNSWDNISGTSAYVVLPEQANPKILDAPLKALADKYLNSNPNLPKNVTGGFLWQPLTNVHFDAKYAGGGPWVKAVNTTWLWFFGIIGFAVLALACINFVNLSTAQALTRAKEVGVRKSVGADRRQLMQQFLGETYLLAGVSGGFALIITQLSLPYIDRLLDKEIAFDVWRSPGLLGALVLGIAITGLLAGTYPAWVISKFNPVLSLKTGWNQAGRAQGSGVWLRKGLVVTQFSLSIAMLIALVFISRQVYFLHHQGLGFDKDNIVTVGIPFSPGNSKVPVLAAELNKIPGVKEYSFATAPPSDEGHWGTVMSLTNGDDLNRKEVTMILADDHYCSLYGMHLLAGRMPEAVDTNAISEQLPMEKQVVKVVVNEKLVSALQLGTAQNAIGKKFWFGMASGNAEIVGVVADFNTSSLHQAIQPTLIAQFPKFYSQASLKISAGGDIPATISSLEGIWRKAIPEDIFEFHFLDEEINAFYLTETRLYSMFKIFAGLAMFISCLGLWGLATFAAQQRTKEIGVRKVLGASAQSIAALLSVEFLKLVFVAILIASPLAYLAMQRWLQDFAYSIHLDWWVFAVAALAALGIAVFTISFQSIRAALANPVKSLRSE